MKRTRGAPKKPRRDRDDMNARRMSKHMEGVTSFDYKDQEMLRKFMTERGKVMPRRITGATAKQQRQLKRAIRRSRVMGLLP